MFGTEYWQIFSINRQGNDKSSPLAVIKWQIFDGGQANPDLDCIK